MSSILELQSPNHDARPGPVDMLMLHYTGMQTAQAAIDRLRDPVARVSSHYVVDEDGTICRLVPEHRRAWHAGVSFWRGRRSLNDVSIGIEIVNPGHEWGYRPFPPPQIEAVIRLCRQILARHPIQAGHVVAHSDVAPDRKQDPGELFPWQSLAAAGIGIFPDGDATETDPGGWDTARIRAALAEIGYDMADESDAQLTTTLRAFQRHWRPETVSGRPDAGTVRRMASLEERKKGLLF